LTHAEYLTVGAACERILPRDEDPGALDLDVPVYIDRMLALDDYRHWADSFRAGLVALEVESQGRCGKPFHLAGAVEQDDILEAWQDGTPAQSEFVRMLVHLTLEGAFGDPSHGGNKNGLGWRLIGFQPGEPMPSLHHSPG
jgi:gluconate 2-dehydrogenase gamma chain